MTLHKATTIDDLWSGEKVGVEVCGKPVLLVNDQQTQSLEAHVPLQ